MRRFLIAFAAVILILSGTSVFCQSGTAPVTQGQFAVMLASHLKTPVPPGGWDDAKATAFLLGISLAPVNGTWNASANLREGDLVHILRLMGLSYYSPDPDKSVTFAEASAIFYRFESFFEKYIIVARTPSGDTTSHIYSGIGSSSSGGVASPSKP